jgi:hypothetical protein
MEKQKHIFIATPMYGGQCTGVYAQSLINLIGVLGEHGYKTSVSLMFNESLVTRARCNMTYQFLESDADYLFWIDADIAFKAEDAIKMLRADKDVIGGIYPKKEINWNTVKQAALDGKENLQNYTGSFVVNLLNAEPSVTVPVDEPCEVSAIGTGFMLIKREVFEKLKPHTQTFVSDMNYMAGKEIYGFYLDPIDPDSKRLLSEDYFFCHQWRKIGGKIYAAPWCRLGHMGTYLFEGGLLSSD